MPEKFFCINTVQNKHVSGKKLDVKVTGCYFTHDSAVYIHGFAFFLEEDKKPHCRHCPILPSVVLRVPVPIPNPGSCTNISSSLHACVPVLVLSGFKAWFVSGFYLFCQQVVWVHLLLASNYDPQEMLRRGEILCPCSRISMSFVCSRVFCSALQAALPP